MLSLSRRGVIAAAAACVLVGVPVAWVGLPLVLPGDEVRLGVAT